MQLDVLSITAHPDDTELTCSGTVIKMVEAGYKVGLLDLTGGESGTRGNASLRERESRRASKVMGIVYRDNLGLPDAAIEDRREYKLKIAQKIRDLRPRTVILPYWEGRHPDHYTASKLGYEACFLAGLAKLDVDRAIDAQGSAFSQVASAVASVAAGEQQTTNSASALSPHRRSSLRRSNAGCA